MNRLLIALIAGSFAAAVGAQTPAPAATPPTTMQKLETPADKAKQAEVKAVTKGGGDNTATGADAAAGSAKAKTEKSQPKSLTTTKEKQQAVQAAGKGGGNNDATGAAAAAGSAKAKAEKGDPKALATKSEKQQAVDAATKAGAQNAGGGK